MSLSSGRDSALRALLPVERHAVSLPEVPLLLKADQLRALVDLRTAIALPTMSSAMPAVALFLVVVPIGELVVMIRVHLVTVHLVMKNIVMTAVLIVWMVGIIIVTVIVVVVVVAMAMSVPVIIAVLRVIVVSIRVARVMMVMIHVIVPVMVLVRLVISVVLIAMSILVCMMLVVFVTVVVVLVMVHAVHVLLVVRSLTTRARNGREGMNVRRDEKTSTRPRPRAKRASVGQRDSVSGVLNLWRED